MNNTALQSVNMLLVEDDPGDVELTRELLTHCKTPISLRILEDGEQALSYLLEKAKSEDLHNLPDLILLDLNMPKRNGKEVLEIIKKHDLLKLIPIIVLTTSSSERDVLESYRLGANSFITKPVGFKEFSRIIDSIENFWFSQALLPSRSNHGR